MYNRISCSFGETSFALFQGAEASVIVPDNADYFLLHCLDKDLTHIASYQTPWMAWLPF